MKEWNANSLWNHKIHCIVDGESHATKPKVNASLNEKAELCWAESDLCSVRIVGEGDMQATWSCPESSGPVKKGQNSGVTVDGHKRLKSQTWKSVNIKTVWCIDLMIGFRLSVIASFQLPPAKESDHGRERYKDFTFDHSYWSFDEADSHYASQEKVCVFYFWFDTVGYCRVACEW